MQRGFIGLCAAAILSVIAACSDYDAGGTGPARPGGNSAQGSHASYRAPAASRSELEDSKAGLMHISEAFRHYRNTFKRHPSAAFVEADGKPPYSWRVAILPFLEQKPLWDIYRIGEPWDSPANLATLKEWMPPLYRHPADPRDSRNTRYFAVLGLGTFLDNPKGTPYTEAKGGLSNTLLIVESKRNVPWTKPEDIVCVPNGPLPEFGGYDGNHFQAILADGSVTRLSISEAQNAIRANVKPGNGE